MASVEDLDKQIQQLKARRAKLAAAAAGEERARRTRQAIILGSWLLANKPAQVEEIKRAMSRPQDLAAFNISSLKSGVP